MQESRDDRTVRQPAQPVRDDRSLGELFSELSNETTTLVRQEIALAKTEMTEKATEAGKNVGFLVAGGAVAYAGLLTLIATLVIVLGQIGVPWWLSALIVGIAVTGIGYVLVQRGLSNLKNLDPKPARTVETLQEDKEWAKDQTS